MNNFICKFIAIFTFFYMVCGQFINDNTSLDSNEAQVGLNIFCFVIIMVALNEIEEQ